jgi:hypothetical protein
VSSSDGSLSMSVEDRLVVSSRREIYRCFASFWRGSTPLGLAEGMTFRRLLGMEVTGLIDDPGDSGLRVGQNVVTMMGDVGTAFDRGNTEYVSIQAKQVIPFESDLPWGAWSAPSRRPCKRRMARSQSGSICARPDALCRGGTSSKGFAAILRSKSARSCLRRPAIRQAPPRSKRWGPSPWSTTGTSPRYAEGTERALLCDPDVGRLSN